MCNSNRYVCQNVQCHTHTEVHRGRSWSTTVGNPYVAVMQSSRGECSGFNPALRSALPLPGIQTQPKACRAHLEVRLCADYSGVTQYNVI